MRIYRVIDKTSNKTVYAYSADEAVEFAEYPLADFQHVAEVVVRDDGSIAPDDPDEWAITKLAFRNRFTASEKITIEIAARDDPTADMQSRSLAAMLRANQADVAAAQFIDL